MGIRTMSIQEGLNELGILDSRINRLLNSNTSYGAVVIGKRAVRGFESNEKFEEKVKADLQAVRALIDRRTAIKSAIIKKNAEVIVTIGAKTMTLAEAINTKTYIAADKQLLQQLTNQYNTLTRDFSNQEALYRTKLDSHIESVVGKEQKDKMKANEEIFKFFKEENEPKFIDPVNLNNLIEKMNKEIEEFEGKVDLTLTRANITNDIEFEDPGYEKDQAAE